MGGVGVGRGMRIMPGSPEVKTVELPELTPDATGMPALDRKGKEGWEGENGYGNGLYADEQNQERDLGPEEYQYVYENGNENGNGNDDKHECEYDHRYEYDYDNDNDNGERDTTDNGNGKRNAEQKEVTSVLPVAGDRQDSSKEEEEDGERKSLVENEVEAEAGAATEIEGGGEGGGKEEQEVDEMLGTDAVEAKINRKVRVRAVQLAFPSLLCRSIFQTLTLTTLFLAPPPPLPPPPFLPFPFPLPPRQHPKTDSRS